MIDISTILMHYKRNDIQREMIEHAKDKEVIARFGDGFSKRPDVLKYPRDILELAKQGATSFHASEELWANPLRLSTDMKKRELENLRIGWDLVIDIDCPYWEYSKLITHLIINALKKHDVSSISCKFSGNKGFHIGIPFEAFPKKDYLGEEVKSRFPDGVRIIALYLADYISKEFSKTIQKKTSIKEIAKKTGKRYDDLIKVVCERCGTEISKEEKITKTECPYCGEEYAIDETTKFFQCRRCKKIVKLGEKEKQCKKCKSKKFIERFDIKQILNIDAILISSRHLYRMPYSLHEKTGLCSIPIDPDKVMEFEKEMAKPENVKINFRFLDKKNVEKGNANRLFDNAFHWELENVKKVDLREEMKEQKARYEVKSALNEQFFPPCIKNILKGMEDGRKRAVFILVNFLTSVGWEHDKIEKFLREWNKKNNEELREVYFLGQLRYHKQQNKKILPPNCMNKMYYVDMRICTPDNLCSKIKNPVNYSIRKVRYRKE